MEIKLNVLEVVKDITENGKTIKDYITRYYVPSDEKDNIVNLITTILFGKFDENGKLIESDVYQEPNLFLDEFFITTAIIGAYTNIDTTDRKLVFDTFNENGLYAQLQANIEDAQHFEINIELQIKAKREYIKENRKSSMDEVLESLNGLVLILSDKAKELDVKKLEKVIKKLNPQEVIKVYQKSGIGESTRDKAIQEQARKIKELENLISSRNVKA